MMHKPKTLVILSPGFPENEADTTCLPSKQTFMRELRKSYPELKVIILAFEYPFKKQNYLWHDVPVKAFGGRSRGKLFRLYNWMKIWRELKRINKSHDVIGLFSFWMGQCAFIGHYFAKAHKLKHVSWICGQDAKVGNNYFKLIKPRGEELTVLSDFLARTVYLNYNIMPANLIPGGLDAGMFEANKAERTIDILSAGSLIPLKQYHLFVEAVARIRKKVPDVKAVLCGEGPEKERLLTMIKKLGLENNITLTGNIPHEEILKLMQQSKVFLHTSNYEGQGMVMIEALYAGAKVVSFVKPYNYSINNWHIAQNAMEMAGITVDILKDDNAEYVRVAPFMISDTVKAIVRLYDNNVVPISRKRPAMALNESLSS